MIGFSILGLDFPLIDKFLPCVGDVLNFLIILEGLVGVCRGGLSAGFMLTETGFDKGSCFGGNLSGGPIGPSSLFLFLFFSNLLLSSDLLLLLFFSLLLSSLDDFVDEIGVMVIELGRDVVGVVAIGIISMPGLRSSPIPVKTVLNPGCGCGVVLMGVMLTLGGTRFLFSARSNNILDVEDFLSSRDFRLCSDLLPVEIFNCYIYNYFTT